MGSTCNTREGAKGEPPSTFNTELNHLVFQVSLALFLAYHVTGCTISSACNQIPGELLRKGNRTSYRWNVVPRQSTTEGRRIWWIAVKPTVPPLLLSSERSSLLYFARRDPVRLTGCKPGRWQAPVVVVFGSKSIGHPFTKLSNAIAGLDFFLRVCWSKNVLRENARWE